MANRPLRTLILTLALCLPGLVGCRSNSAAPPPPDDGGAAGGGGTAGSGGAAGSAGATGSGGAAGGGGALTAETYCEGYEAVIADTLARCFAYSRAAALQQGARDCAIYAASVASGRIQFDPTHAAACLAALPAVETCPGQPSAPWPSACASLSTPSIPIGGTCEDYGGQFLPGQECQGSSFCLLASGACDGKCTAYLAVGAACDPTSGDAVCLPPASCDSTTDLCTKSPTLPKVNAPCNADGNCDDGLYCDSGNICRVSKAAGASCTTDAECIYGAPCRGAVGALTCTAPRQEGESCTPGASDCAQASFCGAGGKCTIHGVSVGATCGFVTMTEYTWCADGAYCDDNGGANMTGVCRANKVAGDACSTAGQECGGNLATCDATTSMCVVCPP